MTRKNIFYLWVMVGLTTILGILIIVTGIIWLPLCLINPGLTKGPQDFVMGKITRTASKMLFQAGPRTRRAA